MADKQSQPSAPAEDMTIEEARKHRVSIAKLDKQIKSEAEKREAFRKFWAVSKSKYGADKELEPIVWVHLKAVGMDHPSRFDEGLQHFGLKKIK